MVAKKPMEAQAFLQPGFQYAVVGATTNQQKYGYRVLQDLHSAGFSVVGVNPKYTDIGGIPCHPRLEALPWKPDVVVVVVPPSVGLALLDEAAAAGVRKLWFQPGADSPDIAARAKSLGLEINEPGTCIMVARRLLQESHAATNATP